MTPRFGHNIDTSNIIALQSSVRADKGSIMSKPRFCARCTIAVGPYKHYCDKCRIEVRNKDRHTPRALAQKAARQKLRRQTNDEVRLRDNAAAKRWRLREPIKMLLLHARKRASIRRLKFNIRADQFSLPSKCPWLGIPILLGGPKDNSPSLDRKNPTLGYTPGNTEIASWKANRLKSNASLDELIQMGKMAARRKRA